MRKRFAIGLVAAAVVLGLVVAKRHELLRFVLQEAAGLASGYTIRYADQLIGVDHAALVDVHVSNRGYPVLDARRVDVWYSLRDLLPGSTHRFGLTGFAADGAKLTIVHFRDGSYNLNVPPPGPPPRGPRPPPRVDPVPIRFTLRVANAQLELLEPGAYDASAKSVRIRDFNVDAAVDTSVRTHYTARGAFVERRSDDPFTIVGTIDAIRGYAMHHASAAKFPLRALANYFSDTPTLRVVAGRARNFDARLYSLDVRPDVAGDYHVNLNLDLDGAKMALSAIADPIENVRGHLGLVDNAVFVDGMTADLAGVPMRMTGGLYDLSSDLTGSPQLRIGIDGSGDLARLRNAFTFTRNEPISGHVRLRVVVQGPLGDPMIVARGQAAHATYRTLPIDGLDTTVIYRDGTVALVPLDASYGGAAIGVRGTLAVGGPHVLSDLALHMTASSDRLPYLDDLLTNEPMVIDAAATGDDLLFRAHGILASARGVGRAAALVVLDPNGMGSIEPFWLHTARGDFVGGYGLDRPHGTSSFWAIAADLHLNEPTYAAFPGLVLPQMPKLAGHLASLTVAGGGSGAGVVLGGMVSSRDLSLAGVRFARLDAAFGGSFEHAAVNLLHASGPWGRFDGSGAFSSKAFVARGAYHGTLEGLQPFLGSAIPGHGPIDGTMAIAVEGNRIVVQGDHLHMHGATLRGVPVSTASLTLAIAGDTLEVYSAHAHAAGGDIVAAGEFSTAPHPRANGNEVLSLLADRLDAAQLRGIGLPVEAGRLSASGNLAAGAPLPAFHGGVSVARGRMQSYPIAGNGDVDLAGDSVRLSRTIGAFGGTYALVDGRIGALASRSPAYSLDANIPAGSVSGALHTLAFSNYMTEGTFDARLRIGGSGAVPRVSGSVGVPGGDVNGLPFVDGSAAIVAGANGVSIHHGRVLVGTTAVRFTAIAQPQESALRVDARRADLSDFNNFFDTGDTLDGDGSVRFHASLRGNRIASAGDINVAGFRYRNLPIGDTRATWSSNRNNVSGRLAIGGSEGALHADGTIGLAPAADVAALVENSRYDLTASVENLDLSLWVPALGFAGVPVTGRAQGHAALHGRFPDLNVSGAAEIRGGAIGPLTLETAKVTVHAIGERVAIDGAEFDTPGLTATASGSLGLEPDAAIDLQVHATTDELPRLLYQVSRLKIPVSGFFESTLQIGGTFKAPTFLAGFDATNVEAYGISMASAFGEVRLRGSTLVLSDAGASFAKGQATLAGALPLQLSPLRVGPANQPVSLDVDVVNLDPGVFDKVLGSNTKLTGTVNGHLGLSGTVGAPQIIGRASLEGGSYVSDLEKTPIQQAVATLTFDRTNASIVQASAKLGSGSIGGSGNVHFPNGFGSASGLTFAVSGRADNAQLDLPAYGSGKLDARVSLTKAATGRALFSGKVAVSDATLPFTSFVQAAQPGSVGGVPLPLDLDLEAAAGKNVRVRGNGYGAGLDIGLTGSVRLGGTLAAPTLAGAFTSTGGTLTYFDRAFRVQQGSVRFDPSDGVLPTIHAVATTHVINPDPDRARNPYGAADITINVQGPIAGLKIGFTSNPAGYTQDQILALIAPFGGFFNGIAFNNTSGLQVQQPGGIQPLGQLAPLPGLYIQRSSSSITVGQEAFNILNAQFAAGLLAPVESAIGQGLGFSTVNLSLGYYGDVGLTATRVLGKAVNAVYTSSFGIPQIQSFGLQIQAGPYTTATLSLFTQTGPTRLFETPGIYSGNQELVLGQPLQGNNGFSFTLQRFFK